MLQGMPGLTRIGNLVNPHRQITNGVRGPEIVASPYRLVRLQDCVDWEVDLTRCLTISVEQFKSNRRCRLAKDDVVVAIGGYLGNAAIVRTNVAAVIGQHSALLPFGHPTPHDPRYLVAFLNSHVGETLFRRWARGTVQAGLNLEDISEIEVICPDESAQRYIGSKVRQAEALREWARAFGNEAQTHFAHLHVYDPRRLLGSWRQSACDIDNERLDPTFYSRCAMTLDQTLRAKGAIPAKALGNLVSESGFDRNQPISYFEIGGIDIATGCAWPTPVSPGEAPSRAQRSISHWDILVGTVRPERKNVGIVPPSSRGQLVATSGVAVLRAKSPAQAAYLWAYLRSDAATEQLMRWNTGAAYPAIEDDVAPRVLVPVVDEAEVLSHGSRWMRIPRLYAAARELVAAARLLVEALIERKVTEAELIAAGKNADADRALLARLAEDGIDGAGAPLFPDLDGLADLVAQVQQPGAVP